MADSDPDSIPERIRKLPGDIRRIIEARTELFMLEISDKISDSAGKIATTMIVLVIVLLGLILLLVAISLFIGELIQNTWGGFLIMATFTFILALMAFLLMPLWLGENVKNTMFNAISGLKKNESKTGGNGQIKSHTGKVETDNKKSETENISYE